MSDHEPPASGTTDLDPTADLDRVRAQLHDLREELASTRHELMRSQSDLASAVRQALAEAATADAAGRAAQSRAYTETLRSAVAELMASVHTAITERLTAMTAEGTAEIRAELATGVARVESTVLDGLRAALRGAAEEAATSTVAALGDDVLQLRMAFNTLQAAANDATDNIARLRTEGMTELRIRLAEDVEGSLERLAMATQLAIDTARVTSAESLRSELTRFEAALSERDEERASSAVGRADLDRLFEAMQDDAASLHTAIRAAEERVGVVQTEAVDRTGTELRIAIEAATREMVAAVRGDAQALAELSNELRNLIERGVRETVAAATVNASEPLDEVLERATQALVAAVRSDLAEVHASLRTLVAEANAGDTEALAQLRGELRTLVERATRDTVTAVRADVAGLRSALGAVELAGAAAADGVAALRAEAAVRPADDLIADVQSLLGQLGTGLASSVEQASGRSAEAVQAELLDLRRAIGLALQQETRAREAALQQVQQELQATVTDLDRKLAASLDTGARTQQERFDSLRTTVDSAIDGLRAAISESTSGVDAEEIASLRTELGTTLRSLEAAVAEVRERDVEAQQTQQRMLRDELTEALVSVSQLVIDSSAEANRRIEQLAGATSAVVGAQAELREMLLELWGR